MDRAEQLAQLQRKTLVVGLGKSGQAALRYLHSHAVPLVVADTRGDLNVSALQEEFPQLEILLGPLQVEQLCRFERIVLSPGLSRWHPVIEQAVTAGVEVVGEVELFARLAEAPIVAITGSNGKSTVTTLVAEMAVEAGRSVKVGGNLGTPAVELLQGEVPDLYVVELSSFQLETIESLNAVAAVVLNISPDHMDRYRDLDHYAETKMKIYHNARQAVVPTEDRWIARWMNSHSQQLHQPDRYGLSKPAADQWGIVTVDGQPCLCHGEEILISVAEMRMAGRHNWSNALAALALGAAAGLPMAPMLQTLRHFAGLPHRTESVATAQGVRWINDSKGTNVGATEAAIAGLAATGAGKIVWIAGGQGKGGDFSPLRTLVEQGVRSTILLGEDREQIATAVEGVTSIHRVESMAEAVAVAANEAQAGDTVLLSPACASFDQFAGFEARGDAFKMAVQQQLGMVS